ncbi:zinc finger protein 236 [Drosophila nasuta]|uniref:zinc finger protein 236 n=1 Tax=Drosophila nasuta TaxID=42062 RepID=UPI00295EF616|nr:zinc finger protein 236 [Drosophila nasuta]
MKCAVHNCTNKFKSRQKHSQQYSFFSFPKNPETLKKWFLFCRKNSKDKLKSYLKSVICNEHFKEEDIQGGLQFQMGLCSKRTLRPGAVPCINKNDISEAEREKSEKLKNQKLVAELLEEAEAREAAEASGEIIIAPDFVRNTGIVSVPDFVSATGNAFVSFTPMPTEADPLAEEQAGQQLKIVVEVSQKDELATPLIEQQKCRTCGRCFVADDKAKDLCCEENAVMLYHIEVITGIWIQCPEEISRFMCANCVDNLRIAIEFRETCIRTELQLQGGDDVDLDSQIKMEVANCKNGEATQTLDNNNDNSSDMKAEQYVTILSAEGESEQATIIVEPMPNAIIRKTGQVQHPGSGDSNSIALGAQIYEDLLNEYRGMDKLPRPRKKKVVSTPTPIPKTPVIKQRKRRVQEKKPKRTKRTREEKNRIRREQIRALPLNHVCDQCGASFRVRCNLTIHMLRHTRTKNYPCPECPKQFYDAYMRNMHIRVRHRGELPFVCNYCTKAFSSSNTRYLHEKNVHGASPRIHRNVNKLNQRLEIKEKPPLPAQESQPKENVRHYCNYCDKSYATKYALNGHINLHLGLTPFKCKLCEMRFADPQSKKKHEMRHDSKRPFECDICLKGFYVRSKLKEHERIHTGERPYRCGICDAYFRYKFNLYSHQFSKMHKDNLQKVEKEQIVEDSS